MCLWLLTACLGLIPTTPQNSNVIVIQGLPTPIIQPTTPPANITIPTVTFPTVTVPTVTIPPFTFPPTVTIPTVTFPPTVTVPPVTGVSPTTGGVSLAAVIVCNDSDVICVANPDDIDTGPLPIDPRLGTTPGPSAALQLPTITGYSAQGPSYDTSVRFPREKRSVDNEDNTMLQVLFNYKNIIIENHKIIKRQSCACVPNGTCATPGTNNGAGLIDLRIVTPGQGQCPAGQVYCCTGTVSQIACGILQATPNIAVQPAAGQANYGEYPWQAMILTKQNEYVAGGVLIDSLNVLTVTHRLLPYM
ncbi:unnamed protein product [Diatraea saccharalis]|uniref:PPAF-2-like Clip domain-containing protein n=1 Tax=Diatraea saccharalis TaxID=40085 RepID=A0A9N9RHY8_9NEOP|nr:unnamed protein product [Diatraea saccharalis]